MEIHNGSYTSLTIQQLSDARAILQPKPLLSTEQIRQRGTIDSTEFQDAGLCEFDEFEILANGFFCRLFVAFHGWLISLQERSFRIQVTMNGYHISVS